MLRLASVLFALVLLGPSAAAQARPAGPSPEARAADSLYQLQDYAGAARAYRAMVAVQPNDGRSWYRLGASLAALKDNAAAADAFEHSAAIRYCETIRTSRRSAPTRISSGSSVPRSARFGRACPGPSPTCSISGLASGT